ncbi:FtsX-like permease family protein [Dactylosporangium sp. NPDC006015]|uniref:FtsX-like permease family protein n=1 Tax=Dactylosporangium sp. NPDC006015 TaxID=3154576 RepID=UPI0033BDF0C5
MISLVLAMLRTRRGQATTLLLLTLVVVGATVAVPAYLRTVDLAVVRSEVDGAAPGERTIALSATVDNSDTSTIDFTDVTSALLTVPGFTQVYSAEFPAAGIEPEPRDASRLTYRQEACAHLTMLAGRCYIGSGEIVIGERTAERLELGVGDPVALAFAVSKGSPTGPVYAAFTEPTPLTVVGVYRPAAPQEEYWGSHDYFAVDVTGRTGEPVFTGQATLALMRRTSTLVGVDATAAPATFDAARLGQLRGQLDELKDRTAKLSQAFSVTTDIPDLIGRVERSRALARQTVPVGAVPLLLLAYLVLYLAVDYGVEGRRPELAVVALHGGTWWHRWLLALGENIAAILVGAVAGCVAGQLVVGAIAAWRFPGIGVPLFTAGALGNAPFAALGALVVALLAQRRHLLSPVGELLRRVRSRRTGRRLPVGEVLVGVLAATAVVQLFLTGGGLSGVGMLAPALSMLAFALVGARLFAPLAGLLGKRALRRGRLSVALAALQLARRPGPQRLMLLLVASVAVLGYAVASADVAAQDRDLAARIGTGAPRVVSVAPVTRDHLLHAVRAVDPDGAYAMAAAQLSEDGSALAVDTTRLATVVDWRPEYGDLDAARVAALLRPPAREPVTVRGPDVALDVDVSDVKMSVPVELTVVLSSLTGRGTATVPFKFINDGTYAFRERTPLCVDGCRLVGLHLRAQSTSPTSTRFVLTVRKLGGADLTDVTRWRPTGGRLDTVRDGLRLAIDAPGGLPDGAWIQPVDAPYPLPVLTAGPPPRDGTLAGLDKRPTEVRVTGRAGALPRLGTAGTLVDLEYANRVATDAGSAHRSEVWLTGTAPPDLLTRLARQGLIVTGDVTAEQTRRRLASQGPALATWFHLLAGALAVLLAAGGLGLIAAVDRTGRAADEAALRAQGLSRAAMRRAKLWTYPALVVVAGLLGLGSALAVWRLTGWALPVFGEDLPALPLPHWPDPVAVPATWLACVALLLAVALRDGASNPPGASRRRSRIGAP